MESPTTKSSTVKTVQLPPRRGRVKREIFGFLANSMVSAAVRAGGVFTGSGGSSSTTTTTPPASGYNSDQNSESS
ncbi:hypothetical protein V5N11_000063 [Cardamine amara subsp. amara]|uniref:Uncharacterized protein n=1 Tax=Cardamine amara subsp. amara TaxID=228776 RepID=A0ABD1ARW0_CARAN